MEDDLPTEYDVIVVGTGMTESMVAAAASRVGKKVLHLDGNEYYGGPWASFNLDGLQRWVEECRRPWRGLDNVTDDTKALMKEGEAAIGAGNQFSTVSNICDDWHILEEPAGLAESQSSSKRTQTDGEEAADGSGDTDTGGAKADSVDGDDVSAPLQRKLWSQSAVKKEYRKFNLDLAPKLLFARGSLVELLISSNIARYAEFRSVTRVLTWLGGRLEPVPCSRADVFSTDHISVAEKRMLMKLMTACMEQDNYEKEFEEYADRPFVEYLQSKKLTANLIHYVLYAIAMVTEETLCLEGVARTQRFLNSLGRYGNTPFLWPMYGSGELPQCFCRLCAVFGGLYHLKRSADALVVRGAGTDEARCAGIVSGSQRLDAAHLVMGVGYAPASFLRGSPSGGLSRAVFVTDRSLMPADKESLTLLNFPPVDGVQAPVTVIEIGPSTNACPPGLYVVHMTCRQRTTAQEDMRAVVELLLRAELDDGTALRVSTDTQATQTVSAAKKQGEEAEAAQPSRVQSAVAIKPQVLWSLYFNCPETSGCDLSSGVPGNVFLCSGPDLDLDFEFAVKQAREIFAKMYPDCEFLPRAPDPEEIVLEGEDEAKTEENTEGADEAVGKEE